MAICSKPLSKPSLLDWHVRIIYRLKTHWSSSSVEVEYESSKIQKLLNLQKPFGQCSIYLLNGHVYLNSFLFLIEKKCKIN